MNYWLQLFSTSWIAIITHKLRSSLTILGVVIGVAAVIILMSIGSDTQATILSGLESLGSNLLFVQPGSTSTGGVRGAAGSASTLTIEDAAAIWQDVPYVALVAPYYNTGLQIIAGNQNTRSQVNGITLEYRQAYNLQMAEGFFISQSQYDTAQKVAILGSTIKTTLFGQNDALGQTIHIGNITAVVTGVLQAKGQVFGTTDNSVLIPLTTMQQLVTQPLTPSGGHIISGAAVSVTSSTYLSYVTSDITNLLRTRHQIAPALQTILALHRWTRLLMPSRRQRGL